jgi:CspA family cold shock protein
MHARSFGTPRTTSSAIVTTWEGIMENFTAPSLQATGTVRWFDSAKGHGFVTCDSGGPDCFIHQSHIRPEDLRKIEDGTRISFDVLEGLGGPFTVNVRRL